MPALPAVRRPDRSFQGGAAAFAVIVSLTMQRRRASDDGQTIFRRCGGTLSDGIQFSNHSRSFSRPWEWTFPPIESGKRSNPCTTCGTQHVMGVENVQMVARFALLRGNIGKLGANTCAIRGHSSALLGLDRRRLKKRAIIIASISTAAISSVLMSTSRLSLPLAPSTA